MNKKKLAIIALIVIIICGTVFWFFNKQDSKTTLTVVEENWIQNNKNKVIDLSILDAVPVLTNDGEGLFFDFLTDLEKQTGLEFNKSSYNFGEEVTSDYKLELTSKQTKKDILIYQDNYVLLTKKPIKYTSSNNIADITIGVLQEDINLISKYLENSRNIAFKPYKTNEELINSMATEEVDSIATLKLANLDKIVSNDNLNIAYNIPEYTKNYVLSLGDNSKLNKILKKYYKKWFNENYENKYNNYFTQSYFKASETGEKDKAQFRSKKYVYGFIMNSPFETTLNSIPTGFNINTIEKFANMSGIEINYKKYSSINNILKAFNANDLDLIFEYNSDNNYKTDIIETNTAFSNDIAIVSNINNVKNINSIYSLNNEKVLTIKNSKISAYLKAKGIKVKEHKNIGTILHKANKDTILAIDTHTYNYFVRYKLKNYKLNTTFALNDNYNFVIRDINENKVFAEFYTFYLSFVDEQNIVNESYAELVSQTNQGIVLKVIFSVLVIVFIIIITMLTKRFNKRRKDRNKHLSKKDKLKYVDVLTSLKNRNYLNDNLPDWDASEVYPQSIIIVDLNNITYINDNYGHEEGDKIIVEAAGIIIKNQISHSDIIRTDGNEFLIYTINHEEKEIVSYIRKLTKELKGLSYGFGAAIGYSMITDAIKTVDDAVNEATQDMRNKKIEPNE